MVCEVTAYLQNDVVMGLWLIKVFFYNLDKIKRAADIRAKITLLEL